METHSTEHSGRGDWPEEPGGLVRLGTNVHRDDRGAIYNLTEFPVGSVAVIRSKANTVRSNHWHREDAHYLYTVSGHWLYQECDPSEDLDKAEPIAVSPFDLVYTPPGRAHRCTFKEDTILVSMSKLTRTHENHEADVVRLEQDDGKE